MRPLVAIFSLVVGAIGWYYLFYSQASQKLLAVEDQRSNHRRGILRRINAIVMLLLALGIAFGTFRFDPQRTPREFVMIWSAVMLLLLVFVALALFDLRLTIKLRRALRERRGE